MENKWYGFKGGLTTEGKRGNINRVHFKKAGGKGKKEKKKGKKGGKKKKEKINGEKGRGESEAQ